MRAEPLIEPERKTLGVPSRATRAALWICVLLTVVLGAYWPTAWSMVEIWRRSETFAHGFIVLPAFLYLVWRQRAELATLPRVAYWPGLLALGAGGFLWLLAELAGALAPAQFAVVGMLPAMLLTLFGRRWLTALFLPCAFLFFAVPFGEVFIPTLIEWTADFTVTALRASGVPVYREGAHFVIPSGQWSVVDACSGIRYLIASALCGTLFAALTYRSLVRRAVFIGASLLVPIVANWLRAYGIVMLGHLSGNRLAAGVDHLIYGWVFFGIVMFALLGIGSLWREDGAAQETAIDTSASANRQPQILGFNVAAFVVAGLMVLVWPLARMALLTPLGGALPAAPDPRPMAGWERATAFSEWRAITQKPSLERTVFFAKQGRVVGVQLSVYRDQTEGAELITWANRLVNVGGKEGWRITEQRSGPASAATPAHPFRETRLRADVPLLVHDWYWLGDHTTINDVRAKIDLAFDRLLRRDDVSAWVVLFTPGGDESRDAQRALDEFKHEMVPSITAALEGLRR